MESVYQIKVEYGHERWINFFVDASNVYSGQYRFSDLVSDIVRRCPSLSHLTEYTIRIRYEDDEGSYVNLVFGDECGFRDVWANAKRVPDREYRRLKIKVSEMNSPCGVANVEKTSSLVAKQSLRPSQRSSTSTIQPRQLYSFSIDETDKSYEELFSERGKKMKGFSDDSDSDSEISELSTDKSTIKTPLQRLLEGLEKTM